MLMLKLQRIGKKHQAAFRLVVGEKRTKLNGVQLEDLGWLSPRLEKFECDKERVSYWLKRGAQATDTVYNLLVEAKIIEGQKRPVRIKSKKADKGVVAEAKPKEGESATTTSEPVKS